MEKGPSRLSRRQQARRSHGSTIACRSSCIHQTTRRGLTRAHIGRPILTRPFNNGALEAYPVSTYVNDSKNNSVEAGRRAAGDE